MRKIRIFEWFGYGFRKIALTIEEITKKLKFF